MSQTYRTKNSSRAFYFVFVAFSLFSGLSAWKGISTGTNSWLDLSVAVLLIGVGSVGAAQILTGQIVLAEDSICFGNVFNRHSMRLDQILYRREYEEYQDGPEGGINVCYLELIPRHGEDQSLKIPKNDFELDVVFWEWVLQVPDFEDLR